MTGVGVGYLVAMAGVVAFGSIIPIIPTGAAVSVAASLARQDDPWLVLVGVVVLGALGAYVGDVVTYAVLQIAGQPLVQRVAWLRRSTAGGTLDRLRAEIDRHEFQTLVVSRLIPGGRIPVLVAAALGGYPVRRFVVADIAAVTVWSVVYAVIGLLGSAFFPEAWEGAVAAVLLVLIVTYAGTRWQRRRERKLAQDKPAPEVS